MWRFHVILVPIQMKRLNYNRNALKSIAAYDRRQRGRTIKSQLLHCYIKFSSIHVKFDSPEMNFWE